MSPISCRVNRPMWCKQSERRREGWRGGCGAGQARARSLCKEFGLSVLCKASYTHGKDDLIEVLSLLLLCEEWTLGAGGEGVKNESRKTS